MSSIVFVIPSCSSAADYRQYEIFKVPEKFYNIKVSELKQNLIFLIKLYKSILSTFYI